MSEGKTRILGKAGFRSNLEGRIGGCAPVERDEEQESQHLVSHGMAKASGR